MTLKNQGLIAVGFTSKDIERIKRHQATGDSQEKVLKDLAGYFLSVAWITGGMAIITLITAFFGSASHLISYYNSKHKINEARNQICRNVTALNTFLAPLQLSTNK